MKSSAGPSVELDDVYAIDRIAAADSRTILDRLAGTDLIARGSVVIISVETIQARAGPRWPRKRDDVWEYVDRKCDEHLSFHDIRHRITETEFLIAMTAEEGVAAQAICLKILEEVLIFFLGAAEKVDLKLRAVTKINGDAITSAEIDLARIAAARERPSRQPYERELDPEEAKRRNPVSFVTASGETVRIDFAVEHIVNLRHGVTAALYIRPTVTSILSGAAIRTHAFPRLKDQDIAFIDRATLNYGALLVPKDVRADPPIIVPASFRTMGARKGRAMLIGVEGVAPERVREGVFIELIDIDDGTPTGRLLEVVGLVGQLSRGVIARLHPSRDVLAPVRGARMHGFTLDLAELPLDSRRLGGLIRAVALQIRAKAPSLIAQGLPDRVWLKAAHAAGFTHASVRTTPATRDDALWNPR